MRNDRPRRGEVEPAEPIIPDGREPSAGSYRPAVVQIRLIGPSAAIEAASALLADFCDAAWQPGTRKSSRHAGGDQLMYGTLIVPVPPGRKSVDNGA